MHKLPYILSEYSLCSNKIQTEFFSSFSQTFLDKRKKEWSSDVVEKELVSCVEMRNPPDQVIVGSDAKYTVMVMRLLPVWLQLKIFDIVSPVARAANMN